MNQILVNEKIYSTPELKRKKKFYKFEFFFSVFLLCLLTSFYIYAEYDKNKNEEVSQAILASIDFTQEEKVEVLDDTTVKLEDEVIVVVLNNEQYENQSENYDALLTNSELMNPVEQTTPSGDKYTTLGIINIPKLNVNYPILSKSTMELLKISVCKLWGPDPNQIGNLCIVAHNYRNTQFFSKIHTLQNGDIVEVTDIYGKTLKYEVYDKYEIEPTDTSCTSQLTNGKKEITLITCTNDSKRRTVVKATEI